MLQEGEVIGGKLLGKKYPNKHIWSICPMCKQGRWIQNPMRYGKKSVCKDCYIKFKLAKTPMGEANPFWRGGRHLSDGYIRVRVYESDFFSSMVDMSGYVAEHRLVMAKHLGRCLLPWEMVHHKNGRRDDNRLENLELITDRKYHMVDANTKAYIKRLEKKIAKLELHHAEYHGIKEANDE